MSPALISVIAFAAWTLIVLFAGVGTRRWYLILSGRAPITSFPADTPHGCAAYRRAMRAHANCVENLPVYASIVFASEITHVVPAHMTEAAIAFIASRIAQSSVHMVLPETNATVAIRFGFYLAQVLITFWMIAAMALLGFEKST